MIYKTTVSLWFVKPGIPRASVILERGVKVHYDSIRDSAEAVEGEYEGWVAPCVAIGAMTVISPLELLAEVAE